MNYKRNSKRMDGSIHCNKEKVHFAKLSAGFRLSTVLKKRIS